MKPMKNLTNVLESDECYTPAGQMKFIKHLIPDYVKTIWCPCDTINSNIYKDLEAMGYSVIISHKDVDYNFFNYEPMFYDCIITNPPYSIKDKFIQRCFELGKPFFLLLPLTALEGKKRHNMYKKYGLNVAVNSNRIEFTGKNGVWFNTSWFFGNVDYKNTLTWIDNSDKIEEQVEFEY